MKKWIVLSIVFVCLVSGCTVLRQTRVQDTGVLLGGIEWATCNVDEPGTFAEKPTNNGKFYQWNRKIGWSAWEWETRDREGSYISYPSGYSWDYFSHAATGWQPENDPCPTGWRIPTREEWERLLTVENQWVFQDSVGGWQFGTGEQSIFLSAAGCRSRNDTQHAGIMGFYWSADPHERFDTGAYTLMFYRPFGTWIGVPHESRIQGETIRCVRDEAKTPHIDTSDRAAGKRDEIIPWNTDSIPAFILEGMFISDVFERMHPLLYDLVRKSDPKNRVFYGFASGSQLFCRQPKKILILSSLPNPVVDDMETITILGVQRKRKRRGKNRTNRITIQLNCTREDVYRFRLENIGDVEEVETGEIFLTEGYHSIRFAGGHTTKVLTMTDGSGQLIIVK